MKSTKKMRYGSTLRFKATRDGWSRISEKTLHCNNKKDMCAGTPGWCYLAKSI